MPMNDSQIGTLEALAQAHGHVQDARLHAHHIHGPVETEADIPAVVDDIDDLEAECKRVLEAVATTDAEGERGDSG